MNGAQSKGLSVREQISHDRKMLETTGDDTYGLISFRPIGAAESEREFVRDDGDAGSPRCQFASVLYFPNRKAADNARRAAVVSLNDLARLLRRSR